MERIPLPKKVTFEDLGDHKYKVVMEPLYPGYGVTLGNSLRRVLLSSLPGAAITAVKIKGVDHEFSTVPGVKEDVIEIILNLKQIRLKVHSDEPQRLELKVKGEKPVTAGDFKGNPNVEIVNPDLHIATLDSKSTDFEMEVVVNAGRGYVPVEQRENEKLEIGMIAVDAIYSPVRRVNYDINNVRVGQITNYDELILTLETDGTISGEDAIDQASTILLEHFGLFSKQSLNQPAPALDTAADEGIRVAEEDDLKTLGLSNRSFNALLKTGINRISQLTSMSADEIAAIEGLGDKSVEEVQKLIAAYKGE